MLEKINSVIEKNQIDGVVFCDLFSGSGCVGDFFKDKFSIISNDYLYCSTIIAKAKLQNTEIPKFLNFKKEYNVDPFNYFNNKQYIYSEQFFITNNYSPKGNRKYFTEKNAIKIDGIRIELEDLYKELIITEKEYNFLLASLIESVMGISNTTGTYEAYLKAWDSRALKTFQITPLEFKKADEIKSSIVYNKDSNEIMRKIKGDVLYIDPPYTVTDYNSAYHLLESIARYDYPNVSGITGRREYNNEKSKYTRKDQALRNFEDLFRQAQFTHILISYSTQGLVSIDELTELAKKFAVENRVDIFEFPYREYKNIRASKKGENLKEVIIYFKKNNEIIRSPLNYTGSKFSIIEKIIKVLPKKISTFVDIMGGAFNVGVNIVADKIIYNEYLPHTFNLIKILLQDNKEELLRKISSLVNEYGLQKAEKEPYLKLRADYNKAKDVYKLYTLHCYCFQNQMRFNSQFEFNTPIGNCSFNGSQTERINAFIAKTPKVELLNLSYQKIDFANLDKDAVFYFDPPYFITSATYNDGKRGFVGWDANEETKLLEFITKLHEKGYKFILSNVIYHNDNINHILREWIDAHAFNVKKIEDVGSKNSRNEVLVTNYDWRKN